MNLDTLMNRLPVARPAGLTAAIPLTPRLEAMAFKARLAEPARAYIRRRVEGGPARKVQGRLGNNVIRFFSKKTGASLLLESRRGEHAKAVLLELDEAVFAYFEQPPTVSLSVINESGKCETVVDYTPDFLVLTDMGVTIIEMRDDARLLRAHERSPYQFYRDHDGTWHFRAAERYFCDLGFGYQLLPTSSMPALLIENSRFLEDYVAPGCPELTQEQAATVRDAVSAKRFAPMYDLLESGIQADHVYKAIADGIVHVDLTRDRLSATSELVIFADPATREAYQVAKIESTPTPLAIPGTVWLRTNTKIKFSNCEYTVLLTGERDVLLQDAHGQQTTRSIDELMKAHALGVVVVDGIRPGRDERCLANFSSDELKRASQRLSAAREGKSEVHSDRSISRYRKVIEHAATELDALIALVDRQSEKGNRNARVSQLNLSLIEKSVDEHYNTSEGRTYKGVYAKYGLACEKALEESGQPVRAVSYPTFCRYAKDSASIRDRRGRRAAYQASVIEQTLESQFPVHGVRPHEVCYIDHTIANIATVSPHGNDLGKPTLTLGVDGNTTHPRAVVLSYDPPCARTVLMLMRDYVRRHCRLPRVIVVDNGKEFHSKELELFCHLYGVEIRFRPPGMPRGGSMIERLLGASEEEVLSEITGNTRALKTDTRIMTKSVDPFRQACWTLPAVYRALEDYLFEARPTRVHPALGVTPDAFEQRRLAETGYREFRGVQLDENLLLMTSPHAKRPFHRVDIQRGVWVNGMWYRHPDLRKLRKHERVEVRIEPWNASVVYVHVRGRWVAAVGNQSRWLVGRTQREVEISLREESRRAKSDASRASLSRAALKSRERQWLPEDFDPRLASQQGEMQYLYGQLGMTNALPAPEGLTRQETQTEVATATGAVAVPQAVSPPPAQALQPTVIARRESIEPRPEPTGHDRFEVADEVVDRIPPAKPGAAFPHSKFKGLISALDGYR